MLIDVATEVTRSIIAPPKIQNNFGGFVWIGKNFK